MFPCNLFWLFFVAFPSMVWFYLVALFLNKQEKGGLIPPFLFLYITISFYNGSCFPLPSQTRISFYDLTVSTVSPRLALPTVSLMCKDRLWGNDLPNPYSNVCNVNDKDWKTRPHALSYF